MSKKIKPTKNIIIDDGLSFSGEDELLAYFKEEIIYFEEEYKKVKSKLDIEEQDLSELEHFLDNTLESPDEVWLDDSSLSGKIFYNHLKKIIHKDTELFYVAITYHDAKDDPTFIYFHLATVSEKIYKKYRRGERIYHHSLKDVQEGILDGDALSEGEPVALGLYKAMMTLRGDEDIPEADFKKYADLREKTIYEPDEIWKNKDHPPESFVYFIREFNDIDGIKDLYYVVATIEEEEADSHALLFSFPTKDSSLLSRYRQGENLTTEEVEQESSH